MKRIYTAVIKDHFKHHQQMIFLVGLRNGGLQEPFIKNDFKFLNRWKNLRQKQLLREDIRDLSRIQELGQIELLMV